MLSIGKSYFREKWQAQGIKNPELYWRVKDRSDVGGRKMMFPD